MACTMRGYLVKQRLESCACALLVAMSVSADHRARQQNDIAAVVWVAVMRYHLAPICNCVADALIESQGAFVPVKDLYA